MPSTSSNRDRKPRSKEDTWKADELQQSLKEAKRDRRSKDGERDNREKRSSRNHDNDDDRRRKHRSEEPRDEEERHRKHRSKEHRSRDGEEDRHRRHREDGEDRHRKHRSKEEREEEDRPRKHRSKDERGDDDERHRKHRSKEERGDREERKHRSKEDREDRDDRKHRSREDREDRKHRSKDEDEDRRKHRDRRDRDEDRERRRKERKDRERDGSRDGSRHGSEDGRDRRKEHRSKEHRDKKHRDKEHRRRDREEEGEDGEREREKERERRHKDRRSKEERRDKDESESHPREDRQGRRREEVSAPEVEVPEEPEKEPPAENNTEGGNDDYDDDDFEDYDDDFEEEDEDEDESEVTGPSVRPSEVRAIMEAMNQENATISPAPFAGLDDGKDSSGAYSDSSTSNSRPTTGKGRTFINFVAAKQRQVSRKVATKTTKRGKELMRLLELDFVGHDILDIPPLTEYELYIRSFGSSNTQQAYTQCGDDNIDREVQTEEVEISQKWTQHPSTQVNACGDDSSISGADQDQETKAVDTVKLTNFLNRSCQVVAVLLEEDLASRTAEPKRSTHSNMAFSDNMVTLATSQLLLAGRHVVSASFSPTQPQLLLLAFSRPPPGSSGTVPATVARRGLVCLWNITEPSRIQKVLMCEGTPTCCCFSPTRPTLAFAGTNHGSVVVWDLRELSSMHFVYRVGEEEWLIRSPTYTTDGVLGSDNHHGPVNSLVPVVSVEESHRAAASMEKMQTAHSGGLSFQLASMDEGGAIIFWTVIEVSRSSLDASETDLGLTPGGLIKIVKSSSFNLQKLSRKVSQSSPMSACCMQLHLTDPNHFFIGTDTGSILHMVRHGGRALPGLYTTQQETVTEVSAMDFCPFGFDYFLAACGDGSVRLYNTDSEVPVLVWADSSGGQPCCVLWSRSRPAVFYTVDQNRIRVWDLLQDDSGPVISEQLPDGGRVTTCALAGTPRPAAGVQGFAPRMVVCTDSNIVQIHQLAQGLAYGKPDEQDRLLNKLQSGVFSG